MSLSFPQFHNEMISQTWAFPGQVVGHIKIIIAEGTSRGIPDAVPFERTRNIVAFSFQHTPLCKSSDFVLGKDDAYHR